MEWSLIKNIDATGINGTETAQHGYMVTGTEMRGNAIPTENTVVFLGGGNGRYDNAGDITSTTFGVRADVDFMNRNIAFVASATKNTHGTAITTDAYPISET